MNLHDEILNLRQPDCEVLASRMTAVPPAKVIATAAALGHRDERWAEFGRLAFAALTDCIDDGIPNMNAEALAEGAIKLGLMAFVPYDPAKHGEIESDAPVEPGDMIYWWGSHG